MPLPRIALAHDYLNQYGGAERVLEVFHDLYPEAPVYTSIYAPDRMPESYRSWDIRASFMQHLPGIHQHHQPYLLLYPIAFQRFRFDSYDLVVSQLPVAKRRAVGWRVQQRRLITADKRRRARSESA